MREIGHFIGGKHVPGTSGRASDVYQPLDGTVIARVALANAGEMLAAVDRLREARDDLAAWLLGHGLEVADSDANFVLFGRFADRHATWQALLDRGVLIREVGPAGWLRVSAGTPAEMAAFETALAGVLQTPAAERMP